MTTPEMNPIGPTDPPDHTDPPSPSGPLWVPIYDFSAFHLTKSETVPLTPALAARFRAMPGSLTERPLDRAHLKWLAEKLDKGWFGPVNFAIGVLPDGSPRRVNGQHTSTLLDERGQAGAFPTDLWAHVDEFAVDSEYGLTLLFRQFDDRRSSRTKRQIAGAYKSAEPELGTVPLPTGQLAMDAVSWYRKEIEGLKPAKTGDDAYMLFHDPEVHPFLWWVRDLGLPKVWKKKPIVAAMFFTWQENPDAARRFWEPAVLDVDVPKAHVAVLTHWIAVVTDRRAKKPAKAYPLYQGCLYAWEKFIANKPIGSIRS